MSLPQRQEPLDPEPNPRAAEPLHPGPRREFERRQDRRSGLGQRQGRGFWIWIVLFIAVILWFCGWGWGGYGGWWWGHSHGVVTGPAATGRTPATDRPTGKTGPAS